MSDAISRAIEELVNSAGFFRRQGLDTAADCCRSAIDGLKAMQGEAVGSVSVNAGSVTDLALALNTLADGDYKLYAAPQPAVPKWVGGHPPIETMAIMHIPMRGYPDYMVIGYMDEEGWIMDSSGDDAGYNADDVVRDRKSVV